MSVIENQTEIVNEEELDNQILDSINKVRAGEELKGEPITPTETKVEIKKDTYVEGEDNTGKPQAEAKGDDEFRTPNKGPFESDESYEKRIELFDLVKRRKAASTPEAKAALNSEIQAAKGDLRNLNSINQINKNNNLGADKPILEEDPALAADIERLKQLGGATKEDIQQIIREERVIQETKSTLDSFVNKYAELKDHDVREVFFDFVNQNYLWEGKTGRELVTVLEMARENMFRPSESIQDRVLKGANVQEKVNAMQFPGNTGAKTEYSAEMRKSIDELKATGMSEDRAVELLTE